MDSGLSDGTAAAPRGEGPIRDIAIVGGGTAGWMAAASLANAFANTNVRICLVEAEVPGPTGVGEATIPPIRDFIRHLGMDEDKVVREIRATFKLGIGYQDWTRPGHFYFHPFGPTGFGLGSVSFPAYWLKMHLEGRAACLEEYSIQASAAMQGKFARPVHAPNTPLNKITYALHFDALLFARHLRQYAEARGVVRIGGAVRNVALDPENGFIRWLELDNGNTVRGDLYIDCSGFRGVLIEQGLHTGYDDWSRWLPCNRALVVQATHAAPPAPYTMVTAREAGWQWRIPLQHRVGNGYVYDSSFTTDAEAEVLLLANIQGERLTNPVRIDFTAGRRKKIWNKNCIALGLSAGFLEPLEATSIHLIQRGVAMLLKFFPDLSFEKADIDRYNRIMEFEFARVRDFLLMHYAFTEREDPFWSHCRNIPLTDSLQEKIELFRSHGRILREDTELFPVQSWLYVMIGQNITPRRYDPLTETMDSQKITAKLEEIRTMVKQCVDGMPTHYDFIENNRLADAVA